MHIEKINSFAEAEVKWNDTKPIRGKEVDMRPLGKRHRKYERIAKIDDNCYALLDGGTGCNSTWSGHYNEVTWPRCVCLRLSYGSVTPMAPKPLGFATRHIATRNNATRSYNGQCHED
jgi:hypothetical protein